MSNIYESLVAFDKDMNLVPALATSWSSVDDQTWMVQLRRGVRFHDGQALTPSDVKSALQRAPSLSVAGVETNGDATLQLRTSRPDALVPNRLAHIVITPRGLPAGAAFTRPIGTGPYRFVRWERGRYLEVESFEGYWGGRPPIERARFLPLEGEDRVLTAMQQGEADVLRWVPGNLPNRFAAVPRVRIETHPGLNAVYLWLNSTQEEGRSRNPLADKRVRHAISLAIDRREIVKTLGASVVANQLVIRGVFGYAPNSPELAFDPPGARRLLREAGYERGFETSLVHRRGAAATTVSTLVGQMLGKVGIGVRLEVLDWSSILSQWEHGQLPFFLAGWRFDDGDALSFLRDCLSSRDPSRGLGSHNPGFSNSTLDRLIDENGRITKEADRLQQYGITMQLALEEMPVVPLYNPYNVFAVSTRVKWQPRLDGNLLAREMFLEPPDEAAADRD